MSGNYTYHCSDCNYTNSIKCDFYKHLISKKHNKIKTSISNIEVYRKEINEDTVRFICKKCEKTYKNSSGLWKHSKICNKTNDGTVSAELFAKVVEKNCELTEKNCMLTEKNCVLTEKIIELSKHKGNVQGSYNKNSMNTNLNLQFFLNETCKDAINMTDFLKSIQLHLDDLEETARVGYVDGLSRIFIRALKDMEVNKRPIHCTDLKRETVYIKEEDKWEKENTDKQTLKNAVEYIANKNMRQINDWKEQNPNWTDNESQEGQVLNKIYMATIGGGTDEEDNKYMKKIIKNVLTEVVVEKEN